MVQIEKLVGSLSFAEGPHWDVASQTLYYVDIIKQEIHRYDPATKTDTKVMMEDKVSFIIPIQGQPNNFVISQNRSVAVIAWDGTSDEIASMVKIAECKDRSEKSTNQLNDAKCDSSGRLWTGTIGSLNKKERLGIDKGCLYSIEANKDAKVHVKKVGVSNGITWNLDFTKIYYIDSITREVHQYDFNLKYGKLSNKQVVFSLNDMGIPGLPDGQTTDADGNLWIAIINGSKVLQINPRKKNTLLQELEMPTQQLTSVAFGGANLDELYVTSARFVFDEELPTTVQGGLFRVTGLDAKGLPPYQLTFVAFGGENLDELYVTSARFALEDEELPPSAQGGLFRVTGLNVKGLSPYNTKFI